MAFKHKFTYEEKVKIVSEYIDGTYGFREICKRYDINQGSLKDGPNSPTNRSNA